VLAVHDRIEAILADPSCLQVVHQPIVTVDSMKPVGWEALARFPGPAPEPPDVWFADAHAVGLGVDLELLAARRALETLDALPRDVFLSVNLSGAALGSAGFAGLLSGCDPGRLVVELTEGESTPDIVSADRRREVHEAGARLAVDDLGAGFAGLSRLVEMQPEIVKMDRFLIISIAEDPRRSALLVAAMHFCEATGATLVAEGIEREEDLASIIELGVPLAQGYLLGPPTPPAEVVS
jgi:EAL domain-containing protein (putative c-di-GMP-specific phosphodiesterase class I)